MPTLRRSLAVTFAALSASAAVLVACSDTIAGPKPPSATNPFVKVVSTVSKTVLERGDTMTFTYSVENLTADSLTLTTPGGCQIQPELDQVDGARIEPPPLSELSCYDNSLTIVSKMGPGGMQTFSLLLGAVDPSKPPSGQPFGYLLTAGVFDASMLVTANEIGTPARSHWVRFTVK